MIATDLRIRRTKRREVLTYEEEYLLAVWSSRCRDRFGDVCEGRGTHDHLIHIPGEEHVVFDDCLPVNIKM